MRRKVFAEVPPRVEYSLTEFGSSLKPFLSELRDWGELSVEKSKGGMLKQLKYTQENKERLQLKKQKRKGVTRKSPELEKSSDNSASLFKPEKREYFKSE